VIIVFQLVFFKISKLELCEMYVLVNYYFGSVSGSRICRLEKINKKAFYVNQFVNFSHTGMIMRRVSITLFAETPRFMVYTFLGFCLLLESA